MIMGFFFVSARRSGSFRLNMISLPGGRVGEASSRVNTVTYCMTVRLMYSINNARLKPTFGPVAGAADPGTMPSDAFHRAKLSSSASSCAYSSADFAAPGL